MILDVLDYNTHKGKLRNFYLGAVSVSCAEDTEIETIDKIITNVLLQPEKNTLLYKPTKHENAVLHKYKGCVGEAAFQMQFFDQYSKILVYVDAQNYGFNVLRNILATSPIFTIEFEKEYEFLLKFMAREDKIFSLKKQIYHPGKDCDSKRIQDIEKTISILREKSLKAFV